MDIAQLNSLSDEEFMNKFFLLAYNGDEKTIQKILMLPHLKKKISQNRDFAYIAMAGACFTNKVEVFNKIYNYCIKSIIGFSEDHMMFLYYTSGITNSIDCLKEIDDKFKISYKLMNPIQNFKISDEYRAIHKKVMMVKEECVWVDVHQAAIDKYQNHILYIGLNNKSLNLISHLLNKTEKLESSVIEKMLETALEMNLVSIINELIFNSNKPIKESAIPIFKKLKEALSVSPEVEKIYLKVNLEENLNTKIEIKKNKL